MYVSFDMCGVLQIGLFGGTLLRKEPYISVLLCKKSPIFVPFDMCGVLQLSQDAEIERLRKEKEEEERRVAEQLQLMQALEQQRSTWPAAAHTATQCNHTLGHCSTLQHTATCCNMRQYAATCCNMLRHAATCCNSS